MDLHLTLTDRKDLRGAIYAQIREAILAGRIRAGDLLPPSRDLARSLGVSRTTVTVAYDRLIGEGFITSRIGAGTYVSARAVASAPAARTPRSGVLQARSFWDSVTLFTPHRAPDPYDFRTGLIDVTRFPHQAWRRLIARELRASAVEAGRYGESAGHPSLRAAIARHVGIARGVATSPEDVTVTNGTQQALDVIARVLLAPGDQVAVEDPGYPAVPRLFASLGIRVHPVPVDADGVVVGAIPRRTKLIYVTPSHQFPLGVRMSLARRLELLEWAERHGAAVVEDDYDSEYRFGEGPIEPLQTLDRSGRVLYVGSFSKSMSPVLRLGFIAAPPSLRAAIGKAKQLMDWHTPLPGQAALARFIDAGAFARHIRQMRTVYGQRHALVAAMLSQEFTEHLTLIPSQAGLHLTAVARRLNATELSAVAERGAKRGVAFHELSRFSAGGRRWVGIILGFGGIAASEIPEGLSRLRACFDGRGAKAG